MLKRKCGPGFIFLWCFCWFTFLLPMCRHTHSHTYQTYKHNRPIRFESEVQYRCMSQSKKCWLNILCVLELTVCYWVLHTSRLMSLTGNLFYKSLFVTIRSGLARGRNSERLWDTWPDPGSDIRSKKHGMFAYLLPTRFFFHYNITALFFESKGNTERM